MKLYFKKLWAMLISLAMILTTAQAGLFNNYILAAEGEIDETLGLSFGIQPIQQLPTWCWITSTQMVLREKLRLESKLDKNEYIDRKYGNKCIEIANKCYKNAEYAKEAKEFKDKITKSMSEFERLYNQQVKNRTEGVGKGSALDREAAFLVYLCSNKLNLTNPFVVNDGEEQNMAMDVVLEAAELNNFKSYYLTFGVPIYNPKTEKFEPKSNPNISEEMLWEILYWALKVGNAPIVTTTSGHHRVVDGVKKENGKWEVHIQETGPDNPNARWHAIADYQKTDFAIKFIAPNDLNDIAFGQSDNLKNILAFNTTNKLDQNVVRFVIDAGQGRGSYHYCLINDARTEIKLNLLSDNVEFQIFSMGKEHISIGSIDSSKTYYPSVADGVNLKYYDILGKDLNEEVSLQTLKQNYWLTEKTDEVVVIYYDQDKSNIVLQEYKNKNSTVTVKAPKDLEKDWSEFKGWSDSTDGSGKLYFGGSQINDVDSDLKLYPMFGRKITYYRNSSNSDKSTETRFKETSESFDVLDPKVFGSLKRNGYKFLGWATDPNSKDIEYKLGEKILAGRDDINLYAIWEKIPYSITYDLNITNDEGNKITVEDSAETVDEIKGIQTLSELKEKINEKYDTDTYDKYFEGATLLNNKWYGDPDDIKFGSSYAFGASARNVFGISSGAYAGNGETQEDQGGKNVTVYAVYDLEITYKPNDGESENFIHNYTTYNGKILNKDDSTFESLKNHDKIISWNTKSNGSGKSYNFNQKINFAKDTTLYAIYEKEYIIKYVWGNESKECTEFQIPWDNGEYKIDNPAHNVKDKSLKGWAVGDFGENVTYKPGDTISKSDINNYLKLYAVWNQIYYYENAGRNDRYTNSSSLKILNLSEFGQGDDGRPYFENPGYDFVVWCDDINGEYYSPGDTIEFKSDDDLHLYAIWSQVSSNTPSEDSSNQGSSGSFVVNTGSSSSSGSSGSSGSSSSSESSGSSSSSGSSGSSGSSNSSSPKSAVEELISTATKAPVLVTYEYKADETKPISAVQAIKNYIKPAVDLKKVVEIEKSNEKTDKKVENKDNGAIVFKTNIYKKDSKNQDIISTKENQAVWTFELSKLDKDFAEKYEKAETLEKKVQINQATEEDKKALAQVNTELNNYNFKLNVTMPKFEDAGKDTSILLSKATEVLKDQKSREGVKLVDFISNGKYPGEAVVDLNIGKDSANKQYLVYYVYIDPKTGKTMSMLIKQNDKPFVVTSNKDGYVRFRSDKGAGYILIPNTSENMANISQLNLSFDQAFSEIK